MHLGFWYENILRFRIIADSGLLALMKAYLSRVAMN